MTTDSVDPAPCKESYEPVAFSDAKPLAQLDAERLAAIRCELDESRNQWSEQVAATVEEDYRQLMSDLGLG